MDLGAIYKELNIKLSKLENDNVGGIKIAKDVLSYNYLKDICKDDEYIITYQEFTRPAPNRGTYKYFVACTNYNNIYILEDDYSLNYKQSKLVKKGRTLKLSNSLIFLVKNLWNLIMEFGGLNFPDSANSNNRPYVENTHRILLDSIPTIIYDIQKTSNDKSQIYNGVIEKITTTIKIEFDKELSIQKQESVMVKMETSALKIENTKLQDTIKQLDKELSIKKQECELVKIENINLQDIIKRFNKEILIKKQKAQSLKEENTQLQNTIKELNEKIDNLINPKPANILYDFN
jgi:hypothetical protein